VHRGRGVAVGVAEISPERAERCSAVFTASIAKKYAVPFVKPVAGYVVVPAGISATLLSVPLLEP
jgi:hypothetical protein